MIRRAALLAGLALCVAVTPAAAQQPSRTAIAPDPAVMDRALTRVRQLLFDPASAEFRNLVAYRTGVVCGEVNSKTPGGEFAGFTRFVVRARNVSVFPWPPAGEFDLSQLTIDTVCHN